MLPGLANLCICLLCAAAASVVEIRALAIAVGPHPLQKARTSLRIGGVELAELAQVEVGVQVNALRSPEIGRVSKDERPCVDETRLERPGTVGTRSGPPGQTAGPLGVDSVESIIR